MWVLGVYLNDESKIDFIDEFFPLLTNMSVTEPWRVFKSFRDDACRCVHTEFSAWLLPTMKYGR